MTLRTFTCAGSGGFARELSCILLSGFLLTAQGNNDRKIWIWKCSLGAAVIANRNPTQRGSTAARITIDCFAFHFGKLFNLKRKLSRLGSPLQHQFPDSFNGVINGSRRVSSIKASARSKSKLMTDLNSNLKQPGRYRKANNRNRMGLNFSLVDDDFSCAFANGKGRR
jgi:hypothetical protein